MGLPPDLEDALDRASAAIGAATALLVTAGAGMGVDSGLPDFRGPEGFWTAYPPYRALGLRFEQLANPAWFERDPRLAWGFYGHRLALYRRTPPHAGFQILRRWSEAARDGAFVFTSNVDGHFQAAGFAPDRVLECHGSLAWLQCMSNCRALFSYAGTAVEVDAATFRATGPLPSCPSCHGLARPNVLMFGDGAWDDTGAEQQEDRLRSWVAEATSGRDARLVIVECGAGTAVPTVRLFGEEMVARLGATLVRINLREPEIPGEGVGLPLGAREALWQLDRRMRGEAGSAPS